MRIVLFVAALIGSGIAWIAPFGPWAVTSFPPAAATAPGYVLVGTDTLRLAADAWRDYMPAGVSGPCGGRPAHELRLVVSVQTPPGGVTPPALDSLWLLHRTKCLVDRDPSWLLVGGRPQVRYDAMPEWAVGDSFTVLAAAKGLGGGQRYLAVPVRIIMTM